MDYACACGCGRIIPYRKIPRERRYFSDACRQRACRARNKDKYTRASVERAKHAASLRYWTKIDQDIHRESWQDELENTNKVLVGTLSDQADLRAYIASLEEQLAEKDAEIIRLTMLLESPKKKQR